MLGVGSVTLEALELTEGQVKRHVSTEHLMALCCGFLLIMVSIPFFFLCST
jgi:hypothetical protein